MPDVVDDPEKYVRWIAATVATEKIEALFWSTSASTVALDAFRHHLDPALLRDLPPSRVVDLAYDKLATFRLADTVGVPMPQTRTWEDSRQLEELVDSVSFPCVVKPRHSCILRDGQIVNCGTHGYIYDKDALVKIAQAWDRDLPQPLVQEMIPGVGFGVFVLMQDGEVVTAFAHQRIREANPLGSSSSYRISIEMPTDAYDASVRLLKAMKWNGVAMVEFKRDSRDVLPKLMEVNGRFWYSLALGIDAGVDFPALLLEVKRGGIPRRTAEYRVGVGSHWVGGELMHLYKVMKGKPPEFNGAYPGRIRTILDMARDFGKHPRSDSFRWNDPWPAFYELWLLMQGVA